MKKSIFIATFILLLVVGWIGSGQFTNSVIAQDENTDVASKKEKLYSEDSKNTENKEFMNLYDKVINKINFDDLKGLFPRSKNSILKTKPK